MPAAPLRHIAVSVEEPEPGRFAWVLLEQDARRAWREMERATAGADTYQEAMAQGLQALEARVPDLDRGPRKPGRGGRAPETAATRRKPATPAPKPADNGAQPFFGFGPVR